MKTFAPNSGLDRVAPQLGERIGVASRLLDDRAFPPRNSVGRSGASPHQILSPDRVAHRMPNLLFAICDLLFSYSLAWLGT